jgi:hypothetical protein
MYDEPTVKAILQRAIELDALKTSQLAKHDIVQIASELGISEASVNEAIREVSTAGATAKSVAARPQLSTLRLLNLCIGGGVLYGLLTNQAMVSPGVGSFIAGSALWVSLLMASGGLAVTERTRSLTRFIVRNSAVWLGAGFGWTVAAQLMSKFGAPHVVFVVDELNMAIIRLVTTFAITTIAGAAFILLKRVANVSTSSGTQSGGRFAWIGRAVHRAKQWIVDTLRTVSVLLRGIGSARGKRRAIRPAL